jgi:beta-lactam-binding protein with PASTA domain
MSGEPGRAGPPAEPPPAAPPPGLPPGVLVDRRRPHRGLRTGGLLLVLAGAAFLTGLAVFNRLMPQLVHGRGEARVPDLTSLSEAQAEQALHAVDLRLSRAGERFDRAVPPGLVLQQDPAPRTVVRPGRRVSVVVSLGQESSSVPHLFGSPVRSARVLIERAGLTVGDVTRAPSDEVGAGLVAGSDPPAESVLPRSTPVHLLVSTGSAVESYVMPELLGRDVGAVRHRLEALGFRVVSAGGPGARGMVIFQDPAPGTRVDRGTVIRVQGNGRVPS